MLCCTRCVWTPISSTCPSPRVFLSHKSLLRPQSITRRRRVRPTGPQLQTCSSDVSTSSSSRVTPTRRTLHLGEQPPSQKGYWNVPCTSPQPHPSDRSISSRCSWARSPSLKPCSRRKTGRPTECTDTTWTTHSSPTRLREVSGNWVFWSEITGMRISENMRGCSPTEGWVRVKCMGRRSREMSMVCISCCIGYTLRDVDLHGFANGSAPPRRTIAECRTKSRVL